MIRFLFSKYRVLVIGELALLTIVLTATTVVYYVVGHWSAVFDTLMAIFTFGLFAVVPFVVARDATKRYGESIPGPAARAGMYIGFAMNLLAGIVSVAFGFVQASLSHYLLNESDATTDVLLLVIPCGLALLLSLGAIMGWLGQRAAGVSTREPA